MTYGDGVCDVNINRLLEFHKSHGKIATLTAVKLEQEKASEEEAKAKEAALKAAKKGKDEPSLFFAICACLTLVLMLYVVYAMSAQYFNQWSEQSIPVFGFEQIKLK